MTEKVEIVASVKLWVENLRLQLFIILKPTDYRKLISACRNIQFYFFISAGGYLPLPIRNNKTSDSQTISKILPKF